MPGSVLCMGLGEDPAGATDTGTVDTGAGAAPAPTTAASRKAAEASGKPAGGAGWVGCDVDKVALFF